ncbi:NAD(P)-dependent dehydrogenase (short-subunit alcohol dehydrogenase family) [Propionibacteriaceae bacterium ES.041]|uniref:SDR family NAD(P)-dependent oxidoreductase n=1 Tax=Enemella evansiae TaxID=2016499 RepID=UPI000B96429E|nr:SDR family oxidoreductase [Enemella evansiae]OYO02921.1 short-chain dehydrogenase [Enemella evansiae]PFG69337.1 NAD(P)-dependent dehydrogenase (short-subunit alcohol dehydrogenase family) [Propionibacteriaceae bacterium ES.041]
MNRHILVTGSAGGIGAAIATAFNALGDRVTGLDARPGDGVQVVGDLATADIGDCWRRLTSEHGQVDLLVNAAGIYPATPLLDVDARIWDRVQQVNVRAPLLLTTAYARDAIAAGRGGSVVNISSGAALRARPGATPYCASKAALEMVTRGCAVELAEHGIRVNAVSPGFVTVDSEVNPVTPQYADAVSRNPLGRKGTPGEIADAVVWLASDAAGFITGEILRVDGGAAAGTTDLPLHAPALTSLQAGSGEGGAR